MRYLMAALYTISVLTAAACANPNNQLPANADSLTGSENEVSAMDSVQPADMDKLPSDTTAAADTVAEKKAQDSDFDRIKAKGDVVRKEVAAKAKAVGSDVKEGSEPLRNGIRKGVNSVKNVADKTVQKVKKTVSGEDDKANPGER